MTIDQSPEYSPAAAGELAFCKAKPDLDTLGRVPD